MEDVSGIMLEMLEITEDDQFNMEADAAKRRIGRSGQEEECNGSGSRTDVVEDLMYNGGKHPRQSKSSNFLFINFYCPLQFHCPFCYCVRYLITDFFLLSLLFFPFIVFVPKNIFALTFFIL